jgi:3-hydroxybutyryl-CoA dehydrogenase
MRSTARVAKRGNGKSSVCWRHLFSPFLETVVNGVGTGLFKWRRKDDLMIDIRRVCVIGAGAMGRQIALNTALYGYTVVLTDASVDVLEAAWRANEAWLDERVEKGRMTPEEATATRTNLLYEPDAAAAAIGADLAIEAIVEQLEAKRQLFAELDVILPPHAILATNSSSIVSSKLADATQRPDRVANLHYFNPALVMELVEVVQGPHTSAETAEALVEFVRRTGKAPIHLKKEVFGFVANRLLHAIRKEALELLDQGVATIEEIDMAAEKALRHPMGPFRLQDLTGLDVGYGVAQERYRESGAPADKPHPLLEEKVKQGHLGRKSGRGWYDYSTGQSS